MSAVGVFTEFGRSTVCRTSAGGTPQLLSAGCYYDPEQWQPPFDERPCLQPGGFYDGERDATELFRHEDVFEHVRYARYADLGGARHPWDSETIPDPTEGEAQQLREGDALPGPRGPARAARRPGARRRPPDPLAVRRDGPTTWLRQFTRLHRPVVTPRGDAPDRARAARPSRRADDPRRVPARRRRRRRDQRRPRQPVPLGQDPDGKIANYQIITPTA